MVKFLTISTCFIFTIFLVKKISNTYGHSWVHCTDYQIETQRDKEYYNGNKCHGYPRCAGKMVSLAFGKDTGIDTKFTANGNKNSCQCSLYGKQNGVVNPMSFYTLYTKKAMLAVYKPGQKVCLAYPAKNHVAAKCGNGKYNNIYIGDGGITIRRSRLNSVVDDFSSKVYPHENGKHISGQVDYKGFQNCPKFCENTDKALCTVCFNLEDDIDAGRYSFQWIWEFNKGQFYSTCWEAIISNNDVPSANRIISSISNPNIYTPISTKQNNTPVASTPSFRSKSIKKHSSKTVKSSKCNGFYKRCNKSSECTIGSTCKNNICDPNKVKDMYKQCSIDSKPCSPGWTCVKENKYYSQCKPGPKKCK